MAIKIEVRGIENARAYLEKAGKENFQKVGKAVADATMFIESEVKASIAGRRAEPTSVDTGRFLNSIGPNTKVDKQKLSGTVGTNVSYAKHLEYGTSRMAPRKHFEHSAKRNEAKVKEFIEKELK